MLFKGLPDPVLRASLRPRPVVARTARKIALCGSHSASLADAPWNDPSWEFWGHASSRAWYAKAMDRYFDLHPPACWSRGGKKTHLYPKWLAKNTIPIYMWERYPEVPASEAYPKGRILMEFSYAHRRQYFANHVAWMIALAISEGVDHIGLFGINYSTRGEYERQRGSAEYWLGQCDGRGIVVHLPEQCTLLAEPALLYGYESHDETTGALRQEFKPREWKIMDTIQPYEPGTPVPSRAEVPEWLKKEVALEEEDYPRPEWALGPIERTNGGMRG